MRLAFGLILIVASVLAQAQATDPPPLPEPAEAPPPAFDMKEPGPPTGNPAVDRYQRCFEKMVEREVVDNRFMRQCLGLVDAGKTAQALNFPSEALLKKTLAPALPKLQACYAKLQLRVKALGVKPQGAVQVQFVLGDGGQPQELSFGQVAIADADFLGCLREEFSKLRFRDIKANPELVIKTAFEFSLNPKNQGQAALAKNWLVFAGAATAYQARELWEVFAKYGNTLRGCYGKPPAPPPQGQLATDVLVAPSGRVLRVSFREASIKDEKFKSCIGKKVAQWRFPKPRSGEATVAAYPPWIFGVPPPPPSAPLHPPASKAPALKPAP